MEHDLLAIGECVPIRVSGVRIRAVHLHFQDIAKTILV